MHPSLFNNREQQFFDAIRRGNLSKVIRLLERGVSLAVKAPLGGKQALHVACEAQQKIMVKELLALGADVKATTDRGFTPLHVAAQHGDKETILMLVKGGADLNAVTDEGRGTTPLQEAAHTGHLTAINVMLIAGAEAQYRERKFNLTAADLARQAGHDDIAIALLGYKKAFMQRIKKILESAEDFFSKDSPQENYYLQLKNIPMNSEADDYFKKLKITLEQGYQTIKEDVQKLRTAIIGVMKQYNSDKILEHEIKQILSANVSPQATI